MAGKIGIGVDIGGTLTKLAAVTAQGQIIREVQILTRSTESASLFVRRVCSLLHLLESELDADVGGVGLGLAGDVDSERGVLRFAPSLGRWQNFNFRKAFSRRLKFPVVVDNDANLAVWGGYALELRRRPRHVVGITLGTGVGGGLILDGKLYRGATGSAGEVGHTKIETPGRLCRCGGRGCLEAYAGSYGIVATAKALLKSRGRGDSLLKRLCPHPSKLEPSVISEAARRGDPLAREIWRKTGAWLAAGLANLVMVLNPDVILICGGVSRAGRLLTEPIAERMRAEPFRTPFKRLSIRIAVRHNLGCVGAALFALDASQ